MTEMTRDEIAAVAVEVAKLMQTEPQLYRARRVAEKLNVTVTTVWRYVADGTIPEPVELSPGCKVWNAQDINDFITSLTAGEVCHG